MRSSFLLSYIHIKLSGTLDKRLSFTNLIRDNCWLFAADSCVFDSHNYNHSKNNAKIAQQNIFSQELRKRTLSVCEQRTEGDNLFRVCQTFPGSCPRLLCLAERFTSPAKRRLRDTRILAKQNKPRIDDRDMVNGRWAANTGRGSSKIQDQEDQEPGTKDLDNLRGLGFKDS